MEEQPPVDEPQQPDDTTDPTDPDTAPAVTPANNMWWVYVLVGVGGLLVVAGIVWLIVFLLKKRNTNHTV